MNEVQWATYREESNTTALVAAQLATRTVDVDTELVNELKHPELGKIGLEFLEEKISKFTFGDIVVREMDDLVVTATRLATPRGELASSVTVITAEDIQRRQYRSVPHALRSVPGLHVVQTGGPGQQTSVFMRGANSNHTLVLIDGVEASDPSSPAGAVDFSNLQRQIIHGTADDTAPVWVSDRAAEILGIDRVTLYRKLKKYREDGLLADHQVFQE